MHTHIYMHTHLAKLMEGSGKWRGSCEVVLVLEAQWDDCVSQCGGWGAPCSSSCWGNSGGTAIWAIEIKRCLAQFRFRDQNKRIEFPLCMQFWTTHTSRTDSAWHGRLQPHAWRQAGPRKGSKLHGQRLESHRSIQWTGCSEAGLGSCFSIIALKLIWDPAVLSCDSRTSRGE